MRGAPFSEPKRLVVWVDDKASGLLILKIHEAHTYRPEDIEPSQIKIVHQIHIDVGEINETLKLTEPMYPSQRDITKCFHCKKVLTVRVGNNGEKLVKSHDCGGKK